MLVLGDQLDLHLRGKVLFEDQHTLKSYSKVGHLTLCWSLTEGDPVMTSMEIEPLLRDAERVGIVEGVDSKKVGGLTA